MMYMRLFTVLLVTAFLPTLSACGGGKKQSSTFVATSEAKLQATYAERRRLRQTDTSAAWRKDGGLICGDPRLMGAALAPIRVPNSQCGIADPVTVSAINGIALRGDVRISCDAAQSFADWIEGSLQPISRAHRKTVTRIDIAATYACRTRNSRPGARISNHAFGNGIDISAFHFADGRISRVLGDWGKEGRNGFLQTVQRSACLAFNTVLGPEADAAHQNHFHFDIAPTYRSGSYCPISR